MSNADILTLYENRINQGDVAFHSEGEERLKICANGDFVVNGEKVKNNIEVYNAMVEFLKTSGFYEGIK